MPNFFFFFFFSIFSFVKSSFYFFFNRISFRPHKSLRFYTHLNGIFRKFDVLLKLLPLFQYFERKPFEFCSNLTEFLLAVIDDCQQKRSAVSLQSTSLWKDLLLRIGQVILELLNTIGNKFDSNPDLTCVMSEKRFFVASLTDKIT